MYVFSPPLRGRPYDQRSVLATVSVERQRARPYRSEFDVDRGPRGGDQRAECPHDERHPDAARRVEDDAG